jgi:hypothetical protein
VGGDRTGRNREDTAIEDFGSENVKYDEIERGEDDERRNRVFRRCP